MAPQTARESTRESENFRAARAYLSGRHRRTWMNSCGVDGLRASRGEAASTAAPALCINFMFLSGYSTAKASRDSSILTTRSGRVLTESQQVVLTQDQQVVLTESQHLLNLLTQDQHSGRPHREDEREVLILMQGVLILVQWVLTQSQRGC